MATDKTQGLPHVAAATAAEVAASAIAPCIVTGFRGFEDRVKYFESRIRDLNNNIFPLVNM